MDKTIKRWQRVYREIVKLESPIAGLFRKIESKMRIALGLQILSIATAGSLLTYPTHAFNYDKVQEAHSEEADVEVKTSNSFSFPVTNPTGVSQKFHGLHKGIDIRAPKGSPVVAMESGVIIEVRKERFGYGNHVRTAHTGTMSTLYAHLDTISVVVGQRVEQGEEIGTVGITGWSTGPHLHFEVIEGNTNFNPSGYIL